MEEPVTAPAELPEDDTPDPSDDLDSYTTTPAPPDDEPEDTPQDSEWSAANNGELG